MVTCMQALSKSEKGGKGQVRKLIFVLGRGVQDNRPFSDDVLCSALWVTMHLATMHLACGLTPTAACHDDELTNSVDVLGIIVPLQVNCMQV